MPTQTAELTLDEAVLDAEEFLDSNATTIDPVVVTQLLKAAKAMAGIESIRAAGLGMLQVGFSELGNGSEFYYTVIAMQDERRLSRRKDNK